MNNIKRILASALIIFMAAAPVALAEGSEGGLSLTGVVVGSGEVAVKAPASGYLEPFALRQGDVVRRGDTLFSVETRKIYSDYDGRVGGIMAGSGDSADAAASMYGAVMYIEPADSYIINCATSDAYNERENRYINIGETVYIKSRSSAKYTGEGRVVYVSGKQFKVEVTGGNLRFEEPVNVFRDEDHENDSRIGKGDVTRIDPVAVSASGTIVSVHVGEGDLVKKGDLLIEYVPDAIVPGEGMSQVVAEADYVISQVSATQGAQVSKGQSLAAMYPLGAAQIRVDADERDVYSIEVGDEVEVEPGDNGETLKGVVASVSRVNTSTTDEAKYAVYIDYQPGEDVMLGSHVAVHFK